MKKNKFLLGITSYGKALTFLSRNNMRRYLIIPLILNILLFWGGLELVGHLTDQVNDYLIGILENTWGDFSGSGFLKGVIKIILWIVIKLIYFFLFAFIGGYVVLILLSPLLAYLSERTEAIIVGREYKFRLGQFIKDIIRGVIIASRNFFIELFFVIVLFFLGLVPFLNLAAPIILFAISAYYYGFSFMDYCNERRRGSLKEGIRFIRKNKFIAIGNGAIFSIFLLIPYIGVVIASFVSVLSVVAATIAYLEIDQSE